jgi:hypothetical protein
LISIGQINQAVFHRGEKLPSKKLKLASRVFHSEKNWAPDFFRLVFSAFWAKVSFSFFGAR